MKNQTTRRRKWYGRSKVQGFNGVEHSDLWRWAEHVRAEEQQKGFLEQAKAKAAPLFSAAAEEKEAEPQLQLKKLWKNPSKMLHDHYCWVFRAVWSDIWILPQAQLISINLLSAIDYCAIINPQQAQRLWSSDGLHYSCWTGSNSCSSYTVMTSSGTPGIFPENEAFLPKNYCNYRCFCYTHLFPLCVLNRWINQKSREKKTDTVSHKTSKMNKIVGTLNLIVGCTPFGKNKGNQSLPVPINKLLAPFNWNVGPLSICKLLQFSYSWRVLFSQQ